RSQAARSGMSSRPPDMRWQARISIVQLLVGAIAVTTAAGAQTSAGTLCPRPLVVPIVSTARHGAGVKHHGPTSAAGCGVKVLQGRIVRHTLILTVKIDVPGRVTVRGKDLRTVSRRLTMASTPTLKVPLSRAGLRAMRHHRRPKIHVRVDFVPRQTHQPMTTA